MCGKCNVAMPNVWCCLPTCDFYGCEDHIKEVVVALSKIALISDDVCGCLSQHAKEMGDSAKFCLNLSRATVWCCLCNKFVSIDVADGIFAAHKSTARVPSSVRATDSTPLQAQKRRQGVTTCPT